MLHVIITIGMEDWDQAFVRFMGLDDEVRRSAELEEISQQVEESG